ncbi:response regulator transcription factor [Anatilimnocola floriformis]|uniref:response regulator transcription factor n=1 Tax=Anatilimnocola floriformis TaxID=2948575 RepID=UPI0020C23CD8|nr:response regulator transcription factor [Anatilimnocola floriformis]
MRALVIEDQNDLRRLIQEMLEDDGYCVDTAPDGAEGLLRARTVSYDIVLLDIMLPKLDGWEVLEQLRETRHTPVLVLSARDAVSDRVLGLDLGADDYLPKPFERSELLARVRALIRRSAGQTKSTLQIADIEIDLTSCEVRQAGELVSLTAREFNLLKYLAVHRGKVISRLELYDHLFAENDDAASNVLDVYVSYLRKKLGADLIQTKRGLGYVIP